MIKVGQTYIQFDDDIIEIDSICDRSGDVKYFYKGYVNKKYTTHIDNLSKEIENGLLKRCPKQLREEKLKNMFSDVEEMMKEKILNVISNKIVFEGFEDMEWNDNYDVVLENINIILHSEGYGSNYDDIKRIADNLIEEGCLERCLEKREKFQNLNSDYYDLLITPKGESKLRNIKLECILK
jgi:hypothetical protein